MKSVLVVGGPRDGQVYMVERDEVTLSGLPIRHELHGDYEWVVHATDRLRLVACPHCGATYSIDDPTHICER
ncbi:MAG: hypothetical protein U0R28_00230 [Candidatus Nanopelagicales bacterium]